MLLSDKEFHKNNLKLIVDTLEENDYPLSFVQEIINQRLLIFEQKTRLDRNWVNITQKTNPLLAILTLKICQESFKNPT